MWLYFGKTDFDINLLLNMIATLKHCPNTVTILLQVMRSAFTVGFLPTLWSHERPKQILWVHWGTLIKWFGILLVLWYGQGYCGHLSGLLGTQFSWLCLLAVLTHQLTPSHRPTSLYVAIMILQAVFKMSLKTSQCNQ